MVINSVPLAAADAIREQVDKWFTEYHLPIFRHLLRLVGDDELANDLLQETFIRALTTLNHLDPPRAPFAWLCRIGTNLAIDQLRRRQRWRWLPFLTSTPSPEHAVETTDLVRRCLVRLSPREAEVLVMTHYLGLNPREIAGLLGENLSTVGVRLHRARQRFRVLYAREIS